MVKIKPSLEKIIKEAGRPREYPLIWNLATDPTSKETIYSFLYYNTNKIEIEKVAGLIFKNCPLPVEVTREIKGKYKDRYYRFLSIDTHNKEIDLRRLKKDYNGKLEKDPNLYEGQSPDRLENYLITKLQKKIG